MRSERPRASLRQLYLYAYRWSKPSCAATSAAVRSDGVPPQRLELLAGEPCKAAHLNLCERLLDSGMPPAVADFLVRLFRALRHTFDDGRELLESVSGWRGTRISLALAPEAPVTVHQEVRLHLLRARPAAS